MHRESLLIVLGILVAIALFVGLPISWLRFILPALGILIVFIGFTLRNRRRVLFERPTQQIEGE